jgi:hypothetical protein
MMTRCLQYCEKQEKPTEGIKTMLENRRIERADYRRIPLLLLHDLEDVIAFWQKNHFSLESVMDGSFTVPWSAVRYCSQEVPMLTSRS